MKTSAKPKRIKRGTFIPLPGRVGAVKLQRNGTLVYRPAKPAARKKAKTKAKANPSHRKTKKQLARGARKTAAWVRSQIKAAKKR